MRARFLGRSIAAMAFIVPAFVGFTTTAAQAADCPGPGSHPDRYSRGGVYFKDGAKIRTGPFTKCTAVGSGFRSHGIDVHCVIVNRNNLAWWYVRDTTTGKKGWVRGTALGGLYTTPTPWC